MTLTRKEDEEQKNLHEIGQILTFMMNNQPEEDFDGYSPSEMDNILYQPFEPGSPIRFCNNIPDEVLDQIPILRIIEYLMNKTEEAGELKLTTTGALPRNIVLDLYGRYYKDEEIEKYGDKLYKETDSRSIHIAHIILEISKLAKMRNNRLSLTKTGQRLKNNRLELFFEIFRTYMQKYNLGYLDAHENQHCGQLGFAFTLILLSKYGENFKEVSFYSEKYQKAFPAMLDSFINDYSTPEKTMMRCFTHRTFDKFLNFFNLVEIKKTPNWEDPNLVKKSAIFDRIFRVIPSNATGKMN